MSGAPAAGGRTGPGENAGSLGERALLEKLLARLPADGTVEVGAGDDCAVVARDETWSTLLKTDCLVEGVHFSPGTEPGRVGRKALARALSDIAAMGGLPEHALVTLAVDAERPVAEIEGWYAGLAEMAERFSVSVVGGETARLPGKGALLSVALAGRVESDRCLLRGRARLGDRIAVTGQLGNSFASGWHLDFVPRIAEGRWLSERVTPTSMMDLSDGLAADLPKLLEGTGFGYRIDRDALPLRGAATPESAYGEGEDYELLLTLPPDRADEVLGDWRRAFPGVALTLIGEITETTSAPLAGGWEHFTED